MPIAPHILNQALANAGVKAKDSDESWNPLVAFGQRIGRGDAPPQKGAPADDYAAKESDIEDAPEMPGETSGSSSMLQAAGTEAKADEGLAPMMLAPPPARRGPAPGVLAGGFQPAHIGGPEVIKTIDRARDLGIEGINQQVASETARNNAIAEHYAKTSAAAEQLHARNSAITEQRHAAAYARVEQLNKEADAISKTEVDAGRLVRSPVGFMAALLTGMSGAFNRKDPDAGNKLVNAAIQDDINAQRDNLNNRSNMLGQKRGLLDKYMQLTGDEQQALLLTEAKMKEFAAMKLGEISAKMQSPVSAAIAKQRIAQFMFEANDATMRANALAWHQYSQMPVAAAKMMAEAQPGQFQTSDGKNIVTYDEMGAEPAVTGQRPVGTISGPTGPTTSAPRAWSPSEGIGGAPSAGAAGAAAAVKPGMTVVDGEEVPDIKPKPFTAGKVTPDQWQHGMDMEKSFQRGAGDNIVRFSRLDAPHTKLLRAYLTNMVKQEPVDGRIDKESGVPGLSQKIVDARSTVLERAAISYMNSAKGRKQYMQDPTEAQTAAFVHAQEVAEAQVQEAEKKAGDMSKHLAPYVKANALLADIQGNFSRLRTVFKGDDAKLQTFLNQASGYGFNSVQELQRKAHEIGGSFGMSDKEAQEALDLWQKLQYVKLNQRHDISGAAVTKQELPQLEQSLSSSMTVKSINNAISILSKGAQAELSNAIGIAGGEYGTYKFLARHRNLGGRLNTKGVGPK